ncbi:ester cyclase [Paraburkholderia sp. Ac-20340]|uniref:ester cyclase n=1 Tax=Paraburkholderia sp. Ac-20340 TaxID=2703888 RepID=UPI0019801FD8|nr:ester cyclase [Paraburkholderia sp. Ac-20340]MBN3858403.1 ester cyclase [Paraburkholderia sp. Ac-20340]
MKATLALTAAALILAASQAQAAGATDTNLVQPHELIVDKSLPAQQVEQQIHAARLYDTFWSTGDEAQARAALAPDFTDRTLPAGRAQGIAGPLAASKVFHAAVPDVHADVEQMIVAGDRVITHLRFTGHFTGTFNGVQGKGQTVDFIATDIYRIRDGKIADNWHLEDNLTFLQQLGVVAR